MIEVTWPGSSVVHLRAKTRANRTCCGRFIPESATIVTSGSLCSKCVSRALIHIEGYQARRNRLLLEAQMDEMAENRGECRIGR